MKFLVFGVLTICGVALAEVDFLATETSNGHVFQNIEGPMSFLVSMSDDENQQLVDEQSLLETTAGRSLVAQLIENTLEDLRDVVINGNDVLPPLDPLQISSLGPLEFQMTGARAKVTATNIRAEGLRWYTVDYVNFNAIRLTLGLQVTLPWLTITSKYDAEARVALLLTHRASGNVRIFVNRLEVGVDARLGTSLSGGHLLLRSLAIRLDIADTNIQITGMTGSSVINAFINSYVQNLTQDIIQSHLEIISDIISEAIFDEVNDFLKDYSINDIVS